MAFNTDTGAIYIVGFILFASVLVWWAIAVYFKRKKRAVAARNQTSGRPVVPSLGPSHDPVIRAEAGDNVNGLPKYSAQVGVGEQIVDRNTGTPEMTQPSRMNRSTVPRQTTVTLTQPPPAYDPSAPR
ncbi:hypothetical protein RhiJN_28474 [Ceratobasidium sp. AG-Ba]|nr:hypothetical protein RhiJN_28474 [Ceratobasidium sp. AG-Ba]